MISSNCSLFSTITSNGIFPPPNDLCPPANPSGKYLTKFYQHEDLLCLNVQIKYLLRLFQMLLLYQYLRLKEEIAI